MVSCHFFNVIMNQQLSDHLIEMLVNEIVKEEDTKLFHSMDLYACPKTVFVCSIRLSDDKVFSIERIPSANQYFFILRNRRRHYVIERKCVETIFDGVEYFMSQLNETDSEKLWEWYLKNGYSRTIKDN